MTCRLDVENDEFGRLGDIGKRREGRSPVRTRGDVAEREGRRVDEIQLISDSVTDDELRDIGHGSGDFERETDDVVLANGDDLDGVGKLGVRRRVLDVLRDELFRRFRFDGSDSAEEFDHLQRMLLCRVEEIESILDFLDGNRVLVGVVLEDELFEIQESTLVVDLLSNLHECSPSVLRRQSSTFRTLRSGDGVFNLEDLLQNCRGEDLFLNRQFYPQSFRMRFGPDESSIDQSNLAQSLQLPQTDGEQFPRFHVANDPLSWRSEISRATLAPIDRSFLGDSVRDIDRVSQAVEQRLAPFGSIGVPQSAQRT